MTEKSINSKKQFFPKYYAQGCCSCNIPTQSLLQKWLREVHNIRVYPTQKIAGDFGFDIYIKNEENPAGSPFKRVSYFTQHFNSYEAALEEGLQEALTLIILNTN